jgi:hypothetical protein
MPEARVLEPDQSHLTRERTIAAGAVVLLVLLRSAVFVFWEQSYFDSDQAIVGLMAKHLAELRAFPVFYYGQNYMLAVEAYLAAPVFLIAGMSVATLKLPLLAINIGIALLLLRILERDAGLRPRIGVVPVLFFAVPSPAIAAEILAPNGGNLAPFAYVFLIWLTRSRPGWCGFFFGLGFLQREFTLYALVALVAVEAIAGVLWTRDGWRRRLLMFRTAAEVWLVVQVLKTYSSAAGPGTSIADLYRQRDSLLELSDRICGDMSVLPQGAVSLVTTHWPVIFGTRPMPLSDVSIHSVQTQGLPGSSILLAAAVLLAAVAIGRQLLTERRWRTEYNFCAYLVLVGVLSAGGYVIGRCGQLSHLTLRYEMLSVLSAIGLGAWFLQVVAWPPVRATWMALACGVALVTGQSHARLLTEYIRTPPDNPKRLIANHLAARGVKYAVADYWRAYAVTFLTNEQIVVASTDYQRIREYHGLVEAHRDEAVRIVREPCPGGRTLVPNHWICPY